MLRKENRLLTTYEYNKVRREGNKYNSQLFYLYYLELKDSTKPTRVGIVLSKKFSKIAVERNRVKRVFSEVIRLNLNKVKGGFWVVIHPRQLSKDKGYEEINSEFNKVLSEIPLSR